MASPKYKCELCGSKFREEHDECPYCGCSEVFEVEDEYLADDDVFDLLDDGIIPNI